MQNRGAGMVLPMTAWQDIFFTRGLKGCEA